MSTKRFLLGVVLLMVGTSSVCAQGMTATLQSGESLKAFYGVGAFLDAYAVANDGDQITLSAGTFNSPTDALTKSVKITGVGAFESTGNTVFSSLKVAAPNVRIEGVEISGYLNPSGSENIIVVRCWIGKLLAEENYTNPLFRECVIKEPSDLNYARGFTIMNCTIKAFSVGNNRDETNVGTIVNSTIYEWNVTTTSTNMYNRSITNSTDTAPYAVYKNCVIGYKSYETYVINEFVTYISLNGYAPSEFYNNVIFDSGGYGISVNFEGGCINSGNKTTTALGLSASGGISTNYFPAKQDNLMNGNDGTPVGIYGGIGFSKYPAIPRIMSTAIDGYTNDEGKINVKVEVTVGQ